MANAMREIRTPWRFHASGRGHRDALSWKYLTTFTAGTYLDYKQGNCPFIQKVVLDGTAAFIRRLGGFLVRVRRVDCVLEC